MLPITKLLRLLKQDIAKAVENNEAVESIKVTITVKKQKPSKATKESK